MRAGAGRPPRRSTTAGNRAKEQWFLCSVKEHDRPCHMAHMPLFLSAVGLLDCNYSFICRLLAHICGLHWK
jgi:hypothetical protein